MREKEISALVRLGEHTIEDGSSHQLGFLMFSLYIYFIDFSVLN